ncbi:MAG: DUF4230 domain-containing protein, partial [Bacteroidota bacterium]
HDNQDFRLFIVPIAVSVYIDMEQVLINEELDADSNLVINLPPLQFNPVIIDLPTDSAVYKLARGKKSTVASEQGAYYDLFGQLKVAIIEKEAEAVLKAAENGILEEGRTMAENYISTFIEPLGYQIKFAEQDTAALSQMKDSLLNNTVNLTP